MKIAVDIPNQTRFAFVLMAKSECGECKLLDNLGVVIVICVVATCSVRATLQRQFPSLVYA